MSEKTEDKENGRQEKSDTRAKSFKYTLYRYRKQNTHLVANLPGVLSSSFGPVCLMRFTER
jgi:hypothetical protein